MTAVTVPHIELAVSTLAAGWFTDYLGWAEDKTPGVQRGATARPVRWARVEDFPVQDVTDTPTVYVVQRGVRDYKRRADKTYWGTALIEIAVQCGANGTTEYEIGQTPRIYQAAMKQMFADQRDLGGGLVINEVSEPGVMDMPKNDNGDVFAYASITVGVDAQFTEPTPVFTTPPTPGADPRDPDVPVQVLDLIINVEAL